MPDAQPDQKPNAVQTVTDLLGFTPGLWPKGWTGVKALPFSLGAAGLLAGGATGQLTGWTAGLDDEHTKRVRNRLALFGALAGGGLGLGATVAMHPGEGFEGWKKLWTTKGPHRTYPIPADPKTFLTKIRDNFLANLKASSDRRSKQGDCQSFIPINMSRNLIADDPWLTAGERRSAIGLIDEAAAGRPAGSLTPSRLAAAAIDFGLGAAAGRAFASVLGLPETARRSLSYTGALAASLRRLGVV